MDGQASVMSFHGGGASLVSVGGVVEGTMLQRQREWEEAKEKKLEQARALKELNELVVRGQLLLDQQAHTELQGAAHADGAYLPAFPALVAGRRCRTSLRW